LKCDELDLDPQIYLANETHVVLRGYGVYGYGFEERYDDMLA
jgi:hypothetical protein